MMGWEKREGGKSPWKIRDRTKSMSISQLLNIDIEVYVYINIFASCCKTKNSKSKISIDIFWKPFWMGILGIHLPVDRPKRFVFVITSYIRSCTGRRNGPSDEMLSFFLNATSISCHSTPRIERLWRVTLHSKRLHCTVTKKRTLVSLQWRGIFILRSIRAASTGITLIYLFYSFFFRSPITTESWR